MKPIAKRNVVTQIPLLIARLTNALGILNIDPNKLQAEDDLYALVGHNEKLAVSLQKSIMLHFHIIYSNSDYELLTVGNAINFARDVLNKGFGNLKI